MSGSLHKAGFTELSSQNTMQVDALKQKGGVNKVSPLSFEVNLLGPLVDFSRCMFLTDMTLLHVD